MNDLYSKIIFIVLHSSREDCLLRTLDSIYKQEYPEFSVMVVDAGANRELEGLLKTRFPKLHYYRKSADTGIASGRNFALDRLPARNSGFVFLLDNDIELDRFCLPRLIAALQEAPSAGLAAPVISNEDGSVLSAGGIYLRLLGQPILKKRLDRETGDADFATGAIGLYRKSALCEVGLFDTLFDPYGFEDIDHGLRLGGKGYTIRVVSRAHARHLSPYSFHRQTAFFLYRTTQSRLLCAYKHVPRFFFFLTFLPWFGFRRVVIPVLKFSLTGRFDLARETVRGLRDGIKNLFAIRKNL